jgi:hypothetical protein
MGHPEDEQDERRKEDTLLIQVQRSSKEFEAHYTFGTGFMGGGGGGGVGGAGRRIHDSRMGAGSLYLVQSHGIYTNIALIINEGS